MEIILKSMELKNFKGIRNLKIDFDRVTNIYGDNGTGKTTIVDAFMWLLFDKDSKDRVTGEKESNFQIKTLDKNNNVLHGLEHSVKGVIEVDGLNLELSKVYKEKWTKQRGQAERELTGHETIYYINEVPSKKSEYQERVSNLINESVFKLITNPLFFSMNLKWQDRRTTLISILGEITVDRVINYKSNLKPLEKLLENNDVDTFKKSIQARKSRLNADLKAIPVRIDECNNSMLDTNFEDLEFRKNTLAPAIKSIEEKLLDKSKVNEAIFEKKNEINNLKYELKNIERNEKDKAEKPWDELKIRFREIDFKISDKNRELSLLEKNREDLQREIKLEEIRIGTLKKDWYEENNRQFRFDENLCICPTCKRSYETSDIEETKQKMIENFNKEKAKALAEINKKGIALTKKVEELKVKQSSINTNNLKNEIESLKVEKDTLRNKIDNFKAYVDLGNIPEYTDVKNKISMLENEIKTPIDTEIEELKSKKKNLELELEDINRQLALKDHNENVKTRVNELLDEEKRISQQIAELEGQEFLCEEFIKTKVELLESSINSKFKYVSFKLFETQVNGGVNECCEALIGGVPFSNANTASQINAGLDIINTLCNHYNVKAPIFIDNRESVNNVITLDSQLINLIVSKANHLIVEGEQ